MPTLSAKVIYYVQLDSALWAVTADGQWVMVLPHQLQSDLPIYTLSPEQLQVSANGELFSVIDGTRVLIPQSISSNISKESDATHAQTEHQSTTNNQSESTSEQQGVNFFYQVVKSGNDAVIADSGFNTQGDSLVKSTDSQFNANQQDSFVPIILTVEFADIDGYINQFESPSTGLSGQATNALDGQVLELIIVDSLGLQQSFEVVAQEQRWQLQNVDFQHFAEGDLTATITAITYPGDVTNGVDNSIKDTQAHISIEVDTGRDTVLNEREMLRVDMTGVAKNIEEGQSVTVVVTDINGQQLSFVTSILDAAWQLEDKDLSSLADGPLIFSVDATDIAGNPANATGEAYKESQASITIEAIDNDGVLNQFEAPQSVLVGLVHNVEDGRPVEVAVTDSNGKTLLFSCVVLNGVWRLEGVDLSSLADGELSLRAITSDLEGNIGVGTGSVTKDTQASITISIIDDDNVINAAELQFVKVQGVVNNVEDGAVVSVTLFDGQGHSEMVEAVVVSGLWVIEDIELSDFADGQLYATADVVDSAGNPATTNTSINVDTQATITIEVDTGSDTVINTREAVSVAMSGSVTDIEDGQNVVVIVRDVNGDRLIFRTTVVDGKWQLDDVDLSSLSDGELNFTALSYDVAGNPAAGFDGAYKETQAAITIEAVDDNGLLNQIEVYTSTLAGEVFNVEDGRPVEVSVTDSNGNTLVFSSVTRNGTWLLDGIDLSSLAEGELTLRAVTSDFEGNIAINSNTIIKDTLSEVTITFVDSDDVINANEQQLVHVRGSVSNIEDGQTVSVIFSDGLGNERSFNTVVMAGRWELTGVDLSGFEDGSLSATVSVEDLAGNVATASDTIAVDILASITIEVNTGADNVINASEQLVLDLSGVVTDIEDNQQVTITVTDINGKTLSFTTSAIDGRWQIDDADISTLSDGNLSFVASATDIAGNLVAANVAAAKDSLASISVEIVDDNGLINSFESTNATLAGAVTNIEDGRPVTITLVDINGKIATFNAVVVNGEWQVPNVDLSIFADGQLSLQAVTSDLAGNPAIGTNSATLDTQISIDIDTGVDGFDAGLFIYGVEKSLGGVTTGVEAGQTVELTLTDGSNTLTFTTLVEVDGSWLFSGIDVTGLDRQGSWALNVNVDDASGNSADDAMPTLLVPPITSLYEVILNISPSDSATIPIEIFDAALAITAEQSRLLTLTSEGQALSINVAADGQSFILTRLGDGKTVMTASLSGTDLNVSLFQPMDELNNTNALSYIRLSGLQTDSDGTTEEIITYAVLNILDARPFAFDDQDFVIEDTTAVGSFLGNDYTVEGPLTLTSIHFDGTDYPVISGTPTVISTSQGNLTIQSNGSWSFDVAGSLDNTQPQVVELVYTVLDSDGSVATANVTFTVVDGAQGEMLDVIGANQEADIDASPQVTYKTFSISAGSDMLQANTIRFTALTPFQLQNQGLTSNGIALQFVLSNDGKTLTAITDEAVPITVFTMVLSATNVADDLSVDANFTQFAPLDHIGSNVVEIITQITALDLDGTEIKQGALTWNVSDGHSPELTNITQLTFEENLLVGAPVTQSGTFDVLVGSDAVSAVSFSATVQQPKLTVGGIALLYSLSADGLTLTAHLGNANDPVFVIELSESWSSNADSLNQNYDFTLYQAFDQTLSEDIDFSLLVSDFDGDVSTATLTVTVKDADAASINDISLNVSEQPSVTAYDNTAVGSFNITASKDPIIDIAFSLVDGAEVKNASGVTLTQNGSKLFWVVKDGGASIDAVTEEGQLVFTMQLPANIVIDPETAGTVTIDFNLLGPIDHLGTADLFDTLKVTVDIRDSDNTLSSAEVSVDIYDGKSAILPDALQLNINEGNLTSTTPISTSQVLSTSSGSDSITEITLTDSFSFATYYSGGEKVLLNTTANGDGWYVGTRETGGEEVFQIRFNANGKVEFKQFRPFDHADASGENRLDLQFEVNAIDADHDKSAAQTITVTVTDDIPESTAKTLAFFEAVNEVYSVQMFSQVEQGADGAKVTDISYKGVSYAVGTTIELFTDANPNAVKYGELVVDENGLATVTTLEFAYNELQFSEDVLLEITDTDGDITTDTLTLIAKDAQGSITVFNTDFIEDTNTVFGVEAKPGDIDESEFILSMVFDAAALQGGILLLNGVEVPKNADGNYILSILNGLLQEDPLTRVAIPNGDLSYQPVEDGSDATANASFVITVNIAGKPPITTTVPINVESVADVPLWDASSEFIYSVNEDAASFNIKLSATSKDEMGADAQGSETVTYVIDNISAGLTLVAIGLTITNGMSISQLQLDNLLATVGENLAGEFSFTVQARATENDNKDTALSTLETVTIDVTPVADKPTLTTEDIRSDEDAPILLKSVVSGALTDNSGSEILSYEFTLPDGWSIDSPSATMNGNVWTVLASEVDSGLAKLLPAADASSANLGDFSIAVRSFATETLQDGVEPADGIINPNPRYSDVEQITITLTGVANDRPVINGDPNVWTIDNNTGVISNVVDFNEDQLIPLDFTIVTSDDDGSESLDLRISGLPDGVIFVDASGTPVNLPVVDFINNQPVYGVSAALLASLSLKPVEDFSGQVSLTIFAQSTELDGDSADYQLTLNIEIAPVIDENAGSLSTVSYGFEDQAIPLDFTPNLNVDIDGSETITGLIIPFQGAGGFILTLDGSQVTIPVSGLDVSTLVDSTSPTLAALLNSGRLAAVPPEDADGSFSFDVSYQVTDTSQTGVQVSEYVSSQVIVLVDAVVDFTTHLQSELPTLVSTDGSAINLTGQALFFDGDIDGSEVLDYVVIIVPSGDGWYVSHPNGAIDDGDGRWIIPVSGMTSDTVQEYALDVLAGATIISEFATGLEQVTVEARVLDRDDPEIISTNFFVRFDQGAPDSQATAVGSLQLTPVDAIEDTTIDFSGHLNQVLSPDNNDMISFRILASDLPEGGYFSGSDVKAVYDSTGENVIEYVFTTASLSSLKLHNIREDYAGELNIPIRIIATDTVSGDTKIDDSQSLDIEITPVADGVSVEVANRVMLEDSPVPLGISLLFDDPDPSPTTGGSEQILFGDTANPITLTLLDGGSISDSTGLWSLKSGTTDTWEFTGNNMALLNLSLGLLEFVPTEHLSGDFRLKFSATSIDTATINGAEVIDQASFENTVTIEVTPVTDAAELPSNTLILTGQEDSLIDLSGLDLPSLGLIDQDGSEAIYLTVHGVPSGAVLYYQDGANLVQLPNEGTDGGSFNGSPTYSWSVTPAQLAGLVLQPPLDFSGDIPLSIQAITQELGTTDFVTTSADIVVGVSPVADGIDIITAPENQYTSIEDEVITIDFNAKINEFDATEAILVKVILTSNDASALVGLEGVKIGGQFVSFNYDAGNDSYYALISTLSPLTQLALYPGELAFGSLDVQLELSSIDSATVLGSLQTDLSAAEVLNFEVEITPEVDAPIWTQVGDVIATDVNNVALNLGLELQNPAINETGVLTIYGVPDGMALSSGNKNGDKWVVDFDDVATLTIIGLQDGDVLNLTLDPTAVLGTDTAEGVVETITVSVDVPPAIFSSFMAGPSALDLLEDRRTLLADRSIEEDLRAELLMEAGIAAQETRLSQAIKQSVSHSGEPQHIHSSLDQDLEYAAVADDALSRLVDEMTLLSQQP
ncbi:T1SS-143 repeat domain-containing protein [Shewanella sp. 0m-4]